MYVCMCVYVYVYTCMYMYVCIYVCMYVCVYVCICMYVHVLFHHLGLPDGWELVESKQYGTYYVK